MPASPIRVGILGLGRSGHDIHLRNLAHVPDEYRVVAVSDPDAGRLAAVAAERGLRAHRDLAGLLGDTEVELVVVASPNGFHAFHAEQALEAGKHVLCEKPFGLGVADVDRLIAAAARNRRILQPFHQRRYEPDFRKVQEICASGILGRIEFVRICWHGFKRRWDWQTLTAMHGGELNNNGPHPLDHALELFGEGEPEVWCDLRRCLALGDAEDHVKIILRGPSRPTIEIELSSTIAYGQDRWLVCGNAGGLRGNADALAWKWVDWSAMPRRMADHASTPDRSYNSEALTWRQDTWQPAQSADGGGGGQPAAQPVLDLYRGLHRAIRAGAAQEITPAQARRRIAIIERCRNSRR